MDTAGSLFSDYFGSLFTNSANIVLQASSTFTPLPGPLASAGSAAVYPSSTPIANRDFGQGEVIRNKMMSNGAIDLNGGDADGVVNVNWGAPWELDPNAPVSNNSTVGDFDFYAALFHEFTHALGFSSNIFENGNDQFSSNGGTEQGGIDFIGTFNESVRFLTDCDSGDDLVDHGTLFTDQATFAATKASADGICFNGANAVAANGGAPVRMQTGGGGSFAGHLTDAVFPDSMMNPFRSRDIDEARTYSAIEIGYMTDIGYTRVTSSVPEPSAIMLLLAGLAGLRISSRKTSKT